jgi:glycosyltransferase involved in cell wall biosynthesis
VSNVLAELDRERFAPELCVFHPQLDYPLPEDVPLTRIPKPGPPGLLPAIWRLARVVERRRPDVVVSAFSSPSFVTGNALALARHRPRWLARVSLDPDDSEPGRLLRRWMGALYARADRVAANAHFLCRRVEEIHAPPGGVEYLPNATDFETIQRLAREDAPSAPAGRLRLISVGRLEPVKRFDLLVEATGRLVRGLDLELVILGEGAERARLEARAEELGVQLLLPGFTPNPWAWLARADLFALCSRSEGMPNALVEAQGLGLAAVVTGGQTGAVEVVEDGSTGLVVSRADAAALSEAIGELLGADASRRRAMGAQAELRARTGYSAGPSTRSLEVMLQELSER